MLLFCLILTICIIFNLAICVQILHLIEIINIICIIFNWSLILFIDIIICSLFFLLFTYLRLINYIWPAFINFIKLSIRLMWILLINLYLSKCLNFRIFIINVIAQVFLFRKIFWRKKKCRCFIKWRILNFICHKFFSIFIVSIIHIWYTYLT